MVRHHSIYKMRKTIKIMKKENKMLGFFVMLFLFSFFMLGIQNSRMTGFVTSGTTTSNVTITSYLSISMSSNLSDGVLYGSVSSLPATNINASHNYDSTSSGSSMYITVSADSNTNVDFCIKANDDLKDVGADVLGLGNETYANSTTTDLTSPSLASKVALTTGYVKAGTNVAKSSSNYYRFWLDIPASQAPGTYNNTISFEGVSAGGSC